MTTPPVLSTATRHASNCANFAAILLFFILCSGTLSAQNYLDIYSFPDFPADAVPNIPP